MPSLKGKLDQMVRKRAMECMPDQMKEKTKGNHVMPFLLPRMEDSLRTFRSTLEKYGIGYEVFVYDVSSKRGLLHGNVHFICIPNSKLSDERFSEILEEAHLGGAITIK